MARVDVIRELTELVVNRFHEDFPALPPLVASEIGAEVARVDAQRDMLACFHQGILSSRETSTAFADRLATGYLRASGFLSLEDALLFAENLSGDIEMFLERAVSDSTA